MRAGTPALPARAGLRVCGRDARAPRMHVVLGSWFLVLGSGRPRTQGRSELRVCGRGRPRTQGRSGLRVCGRDARAPRDAQDCAYAGETPAHPGTRRIARMRAGRPRTQGRAGLRVCGRERPRTRHAQDCAYAGGDARAPRDAQDCAYAGGNARAPGTRRGRAHAGGTPALLARAGVAHMRAGRPRSQGRSPP